MKLLVIGHSVLDVIRIDEENTISAGGIYYTVSNLINIKTKKDEIFLCSQFDEKTSKYFKSIFEQVNNKYLHQVKEIPEVYLTIFTDKEREETYRNITDNLLIDFDNLDQFDGILINMITGFDIDLNQLQQIRKIYNGLIYIDVHTLSRGFDAKLKRNFRNIPDFNEWAKCIDIIQVNQSELFTLSERESEIEIINEIFTYGVKIVCVTKGNLGAKAYFNKSNEIVSCFIGAKKIQNPNSVGCGDIFGASFFYSYIRNNSANHSLSLAVQTAEKFVERKAD
jgi:sugar/nucleoside kinase (ribokinase family)